MEVTDCLRPVVHRFSRRRNCCQGELGHVARTITQNAKNCIKSSAWIVAYGKANEIMKHDFLDHNSEFLILDLISFLNELASTRAHSKAEIPATCWNSSYSKIFCPHLYLFQGSSAQLISVAIIRLQLYPASTRSSHLSKRQYIISSFHAGVRWDAGEIGWSGNKMEQFTSQLDDFVKTEGGSLVAGANRVIRDFSALHALACQTTKRETGGRILSAGTRIQMTTPPYQQKMGTLNVALSGHLSRYRVRSRHIIPAREQRWLSRWGASLFTSVLIGKCWDYTLN